MQDFGSQTHCRSSARYRRHRRHDPYRYVDQDASIAAILMQLQAADLGLGSCWIQVRGRFGAMDEPAEDFVRETLGIPEEMGVLCILSIGHKDEERKPFDEEK